MALGTLYSRSLEICFSLTVRCIDVSESFHIVASDKLLRDLK